MYIEKKFLNNSPICSPIYTNDDSYFNPIINNSLDVSNIELSNSDKNILNIIPIVDIEKLKLDDKDNSSLLLNKKRKTKESDKFRSENLKRKCKHLVIESAIEFINKKINDTYNGDIGAGLVKKKILKLNQNQKKDSHVVFNQKFLHMSLKDILSQNITSKIKYYSKEHNKNLINELINEKGEIFEKIFNITFIECLQHFAGIKNIQILNGLTLFSELKEEIIENDDIYYCENLELYLKEYEKRINEAKPRKSNKDKNKSRKMVFLDELNNI